MGILFGFAVLVKNREVAALWRLVSNSGALQHQKRMGACRTLFFQCLAYLIAETSRVGHICLRDGYCSKRGVLWIVLSQSYPCCLRKGQQRRA